MRIRNERHTHTHPVSSKPFLRQGYVTSQLRPIKDTNAFISGARLAEWSVEPITFQLQNLSTTPNITITLHHLHATVKNALEECPGCFPRILRNNRWPPFQPTSCRRTSRKLNDAFSVQLSNDVWKNLASTRTPFKPLHKTRQSTFFFFSLFTRISIISTSLELRVSFRNERPLFTRSLRS